MILTPAGDQKERERKMDRFRFDDYRDVIACAERYIQLHLDRQIAAHDVRAGAAILSLVADVLHANEENGEAQGAFAGLEQHIAGMRKRARVGDKG